MIAPTNLIDSLRRLRDHQGEQPLSCELQEALFEVTNTLSEVHNKDRFADALGLAVEKVGVDCTPGFTKKPYIPWIRIFSMDPKDHAQKPTDGYFVVFLVGWDRRLYIAILPGVDNGKKPDCELDAIRGWARSVLGIQALDGFLLCISLRAPNSEIARKYERALVLAEEVDLERITEDSLLERVCRQLELLAHIYAEQSRIG